MKKFLLLLTLSTLFMGCSEFQPSDVPNPFQEAYNDVFKRSFGIDSISSEQTWGFYIPGDEKETRAVNVNGNLWEEIPAVTEEEQALVFKYVNYTTSKMREIGHKYTEKLPEDLVTYWVTQVWSGTDSYGSYDTPNDKNVLGSGNMDNLNVAKDRDAHIDENGNLVGNWFHVNNFNAGDDANYGGNTLIEDAGCNDFAYNSSQDSKYHNKWIAVDGADIDPSLSGYYYICFDFISDKGSYTNFQAPGIGNVEVPGAYRTVEEAVEAGAMGKTYVWNQDTQSTEIQWIPVGLDWSISNVVNGNMCIPADNVYTDWIVRITKATPADDNPGDDDDDDRSKYGPCRIICEDLLTTLENGTTQVNLSDWDYNDLIFDAEIKDGLVTIVIQSLGGTLPIYIEGWSKELHQEIGRKTGDMVYKNLDRYADKAADGNYYYLNHEIKFKQTDDVKYIHDIKVLVEKNGLRYELFADKGQAPAKICVGKDFDWCDERQNIITRHPNFVDWVKHKDKYSDQFDSWYKFIDSNR